MMEKEIFTWIQAWERSATLVIHIPFCAERCLAAI